MQDYKRNFDLFVDNLCRQADKVGASNRADETATDWMRSTVSLFRDRGFLLKKMRLAFRLKGTVPALLLISAWLSSLPMAAQTSLPIFSVTTYGATGRKTDNARTAIQKAIDACAKAGGGTA